jgi:hypothetical protein
MCAGPDIEAVTSRAALGEKERKNAFTRAGRMAVSVPLGGLEEGKEENCCTGRGATRLNLEGQTATMVASGCL